MAHQALLIGVGDYPGGSNDLPSAEKDIRFWKDHLVRHCAVPEEDVQLLRNNRATNVEVRACWERARAKVGPVDRFYLVYSGHGDRVPTAGGQEEALLLHDGPLFGSELEILSASLPPTAVQIFLLDCCFSGSFDPLPAARRPKSASGLPKPGEPAVRAEAALALTEKLPTPVVFAACGHGQLAAAASAQTWGYSAFTFSFNFIRQKAGSLNADFNTLCHFSGVILRRLGYRQQPQLHGPVEKRSGKWFHHA